MMYVSTSERQASILSMYSLLLRATTVFPLSALNKMLGLSLTNFFVFETAFNIFLSVSDLWSNLCIGFKKLMNCVNAGKLSF